MRIQHNITAMNAYRNYSNNTSALSKNLEKLSSGYKINRAGDDAAGLAISEKMRAQISGLEQAQANANSGINLVQTAEGALTEVHDMLNRMVTLAEQSANGTYDDDVDRVQLQKEVDQLRTEIDRIADSANFNGINLLDGSLALSDAVEASSSTEMVVSSGMDRILSTVMGDDELAAVAAGEKTILDSYNGNAAKGVFTVDLSKLSFSNPANVVAGSATMGTLNITIGDFSIDITLKHSTASTASISAQIKFTYGAGTHATTASLTVTATAGNLMKSIAASIAAKIGSAAASSVTLNGVQWKVSDASGKLTFTQVATATSWEEAQTNFDVQVTWSGNCDSGTTSLLTNDVGGSSSSTSSASFIIKNSLNDGTVTTTAGVPDVANNVANTVFSITADDIKDGTQIVIGTKTYVLAVGADSAWSSSAVSDLGSTAKRVDLTSMDADNVDLNRALQTLCKAAGGKANLTIATVNGGTADVKFDLGVSDGSNGVPTGITLVRSKAATGNDGSTGAKSLFDTLDKLASNFKIGVNNTTVTEAKEAGKGLTLQIGDTADEYNQLNVSINDCHAAAIGIGDIDISTQDGAAEAVDKIKDAINYVSDVRGTLGATQNRLDHTINNLSVMQENIQDAESTIRDVDVAEEMMEYTKNNILVQSAQAMLAQANQFPQGVLQLLQ